MVAWWWVVAAGVGGLLVGAAAGWGAAVFVALCFRFTKHDVEIEQHKRGLEAKIGCGTRRTDGRI